MKKYENKFVKLKCDFAVDEFKRNEIILITTVENLGNAFRVDFVTENFENDYFILYKENFDTIFEIIE